MKIRTAKKPDLLTRRDFFRTSAVAMSGMVLTGPRIVPASVFGANAPSNRIVIGCIGVGGMGTNNMMGLMANKDVQIVAVCDVEKGSREYGHWYNKGGWLGREPAQKRVEEYYARQKGTGNFKGCAGYVDFREMLVRDDIDAVVIATPDHWHATPTIMAAETGKDIYCEKPLALTISEGRAMVKAVRRHRVVFQTGTHHRSANQHLRFVCELVRNGRIGKLKRIIAYVGPNNRTPPPVPWQLMSIPEGFNYDMWLGPAPWKPYHKKRCHYTFRFILDYSGGQTTNLGAHVLDIAQWANDTELTGPVEVEDLGGEFPKDGLFNTPTKVHFRARYANGVELICQTSSDGRVMRFEGTEGWIETGWKTFKTHPKSLRNSVIKPNEIHLYRSKDHHRNFLNCIKTRRDPIAPVEIGHRSTSICHLGNIAMMLKRKLWWDPNAECFINDEQALRCLSKPMRAPWHL